jgi:hypothetical protein
MKKGCGILFSFALVFILLNFLPFGCNRVEITEDPVSELIGVESMEPMFTLLLFDMKEEGVFSKTYKHRYRVLKEKEGKVVGLDSKWYNVSSSYFQQNQNNLGMEMAAKDSTGTLARTIGPPGYTNYIGNSRYGAWKQVEGDSLADKFWQFSLENAYIKTLLQLPTGKIHQKNHTEARNHYSRGFIYYGIVTSGGRRRYGTYSSNSTYGNKWSRGGGGYGK